MSWRPVTFAASMYGIAVYIACKLGISLAVLSPLPSFAIGSGPDPWWILRELLGELCGAILLLASVAALKPIPQRRRIVVVGVLQVLLAAISAVLIKGSLRSPSPTLTNFLFDLTDMMGAREATAAALGLFGYADFGGPSAPPGYPVFLVAPLLAAVVAQAVHNRVLGQAAREVKPA